MTFRPETSLVSNQGLNWDHSELDEIDCNLWLGLLKANNFKF